MDYYTAKKDSAAEKKVVLDDMILTKELPTAAGSKMLEGYMSLFDAEVVERLEKNGFSVSGKAKVGELSVDLLGETSYFGKVVDENGSLNTASSELLKKGECMAAIGLDANGTPRRAAALSGQVCIKPTYGTVSRFGTISVACSGEAVSVTANKASECKAVLDTIVGHDDKDGTSHGDEKCDLIKTGADFTPVKKVAILSFFTEKADDNTKARIADAKAVFEKNGVKVDTVDEDVISKAGAAWSILMSAELCNNVSRYDGVKYGYRSKDYTTIDELYTNSRTEAFGELLKNVILFGSETLSTENYMRMYDKSLRVRRLVVNAFEELFKEYDAVILPASAKTAYTVEDTANNKYIAYDENLYTAPATITGLPALVVGGIQLIGNYFSENALFDAAKFFEGDGK